MPTVRYVLQGNTPLGLDSQLPRFVPGGAAVLDRVDPANIDIDLTDASELEALDTYMAQLGFVRVDTAVGKQPIKNVEFEVTTTDGNPTTLGVWSPTIGNAGDLIRVWDAFIVGRLPDGSSGRLQLCHAAAINRGASGVLAAPQQTVDQEWGSGNLVPPPTCLMESGEQLICQVTGLAGTTINWICRASVLIDRAP